MYQSLSAVLILMAVPLTGCIGDVGADLEEAGIPIVDELWAENALPFGEGHDHTDASQHDHITTPNFSIVGWDPLITDFHGTTSGSYWCGEVARDAADDRDIAVVHSFDTEIAFVVVDVTDPAAPQKLGEYTLPMVPTYDVSITPDGKYVIIGANPPRRPSPVAAAEELLEGQGTMTVVPEFTNACGQTTRGPEEQLPLGPGIVLVDVSDPLNPVFRDYKVQPFFGPHSVFSTIIDGEYIVLGSILNLVHAASYHTFFTIDETGPTGAQLTPYGVYQVQSAMDVMDGEFPLTNGHLDGWVQVHPVTGQTIAYLANWNGGLEIVELVQPGVILPMAHWNDYAADGGSGMTGQIHGAYPLPEAWDDKHYTIVGQEIVTRPVDRPTGEAIVFDTTDPSAPTPVARWTLPVDVQWDERIMFSTHYMQVIDRTMFIAMYHGGVWAVDMDLSTPELPTLGVFAPTNVSPQPPTVAVRAAPWAPQVLEVLALESGELLVFDGTSGAYTIAFDAAMDLPIPEPWTGDKWLTG